MIPALAEQHAEQASFLWLQRDRASLSALYTRDDLDALDERIEAHLDGLRVGGDGAFAICKGLIGLDDAGEIFAVAQLALSTNRFEELAPVLDAGGDSNVLARGVVAAIGWTPAAVAAPALEALLDAACPPALTLLGIAGAVAHRQDPGTQLERALFADDVRLQARALRAAGELGRADLLAEVSAAVDAEDERVRFWARWAARLLGDEAAARKLWDLALAPGELGDRAAALGARASRPELARAELATMAARPERARAAVLGYGALGDAALLPWLCDAMQAPALARAAGSAFTMITGVDVREGGLEGTELLEDDVALPDYLLPWPDPAAARRVVDALKLPAGTRLLAGRPIEPAWIEQVLLGRGSQALRHAAAIERALSRADTPLVEVRAPTLRRPTA